MSSQTAATAPIRAQPSPLCPPHHYLLEEPQGQQTQGVCLKCGHAHPRARFQEWVTPEGQAPDCEKCGGLMKPATISFGQMLKPEVLERASEEAQNCDLFLVVGSSLVVYPAAGLPLLAVRNGATLAIVNREETPHDEYAGVVVHASAGETLTQVLKAAAPEGMAALPRPS